MLAAPGLYGTVMGQLKACVGKERPWEKVRFILSHPIPDDTTIWLDDNEIHTVDWWWQKIFYLCVFCKFFSNETEAHIDPKETTRYNRITTNNLNVFWGVFYRSPNIPGRLDEKVGSVIIKLEPFTTTNGLITQTLKTKRDVVTERFSKEIEAIYAAKRWTDDCRTCL